jgi:hypothetical protein
MNKCFNFKIYKEMPTPRQNFVLLIFVLCFIIVIVMFKSTSNLHQNFLDNSNRNNFLQTISSKKKENNYETKRTAEEDQNQDDDSDNDEIEEGDSDDAEIVSKSDQKKNKNKKSKNFPKFTIPSGLDQVVRNSYAYTAATHWWYSNEVIRFHHGVRDAAEKLLGRRNSSFSKKQQQSDDDDANTPKCHFSKIRAKYYYTHRSPRKNELGNIQMALTTKSLAAAYVSIGEPLHRVVNPHPVQLSNDFDFFSKKLGKWHVTFVGRPEQAHSSPQRVPAEPEMSVALFRHAVVSYGNVVTCDGDMFTAGGCLWEGPGHAALSSHREVHNIVAVALCDGWCRGYYHFSHEHLPRIAMVHDLLIHNPHARLVLSHEPVAYARQFYTDILGIPRDKFIVAGSGGLKADVVALPTPMRCGNAFTSALVGLRRIVLARVVPQFHPRHVGMHASREDVEDEEENAFPPTYTRHAGKIRLLFAERSHLSRMPRNWAELKAFVREEYADVIEFEETQGNGHAREQVLRFYRADIVLGPHGANLANIMFMRPGRHVLEMGSAKDGNLCYYSTAMRVNLTHHLVLHDKGKDSHYTLTKEILKKHLDEAVAAVKDLPP